VLAAKGAAQEKVPWQDVQTLVHEVQVRQIELEMQNEELRRTNQELEDLRFKYAISIGSPRGTTGPPSRHHQEGIPPGADDGGPA
jgi:hypothetical protein